MVITPDFDLEPKLPATPVRIWARPELFFLHFLGFFVFRGGINNRPSCESNTMVVENLILTINEIGKDMVGC